MRYTFGCDGMESIEQSALFPNVQGTSGLRIRVGQLGLANKSIASRIRRRSRTHHTQAHALPVGAMKDRLRRWPFPMVIARIRRGAHDRAKVTEPCRGRPTARCQLPSGQLHESRAMPVPGLSAHRRLTLKSRAARGATEPPPTDIPEPLRSAEMQDAPGEFSQAASGSHSGL